jgi:exopolyphosphatase / guanosine-5'-triphosphate,3'-diphosphate pyrophosphatase
MRRLAVIDLGTNTFTMLVAEVSENQLFKRVFHDRFYIKLAEEGIATIGIASFDRAVAALEKFKTAIDEYDVKVVRALGTAALRTATNGADLVQTIFEKTGIQVEIIDGDSEADYIFEGVRAAFPLAAAYDLIMDIGGGSVEFIIANQNGKHWAQSFPIGMAVLKKEFHHSDPISQSEIIDIEKHLLLTLQPLQLVIQNLPIRYLIGASGTFDVLERLFTQERINDVASTIRLEDTLAFCDSIIPMSSDARYRNQDIPDQRVDMVVVALVLIRFIIQTFDIQGIGVSGYAMKEGLISVLSRFQDQSN